MEKLNEHIGGLLSHVKKPSRYIGNEFNSCCKNWEAATFRAALVFPDLYEIGMSHHGLQILYEILNGEADMLADRVYAPDRDLEELLRSRGQPMFAVESRRPLAEFDMLGITLPYELCYTNILTILALGRISLRAAERHPMQPYVIGGGSNSFNPEPVADFFDAVLLGDGEEALLEIAEVLKGARAEKIDRHQTLEKLAAISGVYVPSFFAPRYDGAGKLVAIKPLKKGYEKIERRILPDLETSRTVTKPLVPLVRIVHDRLGIEVARGCTRGCRFCQAGIIYRPVRERSAGRVLELAEQGMAAGGFEELALLSLSTGDYSCLFPLLGRLMDRFAREHVSVSMPSMRVGTLTPDIMNQIRRVRKTGFTLAPEAGSDRLRKVINKGIAEEDLLATCRDASSMGWKLLKLYFMLGLPTETEEDIRAIADLVVRAGRAADDRQLRINISAAVFVPKPHTPFQWEPQITIDEAFARINLLRSSLPRGNYKLKWHDPRQSFLEGVMARGDRHLSRVIEAAWQRGARLDAWSEHFDLERWQEAARAIKMDLSQYLRRRELSEVLPWQHLETGVTAEFLQRELARALNGEYTPDCRVHGCQKCGSCDLKEVRPVVHAKPWSPDKGGKGEGPCGQPHVPAAAPDQAAHEPHFWYRLFYSKQGDIRFLSHLELIQSFFQAFRRAGLQLHFTQGFNPVPKVSFSPALPVGTESLAEFLDIDLAKRIANEAEFLDRLNRQLPAGIVILTVGPIPAGKPGPAAKNLSCYAVSLDRDLSAAERSRLALFMDLETFPIAKCRKGKMRTVDIRHQVESLTSTGSNSLELVLSGRQGQGGAKPAEILKAVLQLTADEFLALRILKMWSKPWP